MRHVDAPTVLTDSLALAGTLLALVLGRLVVPGWQLLWVLLQPLPSLVSAGDVRLANSVNRYLLAAFPAFFVLGWRLRGRPAVTAAVFALGLCGMIVLTRNFARGFFIA